MSGTQSMNPITPRGRLRIIVRRAGLSYDRVATMMGYSHGSGVQEFFNPKNPKPIPSRIIDKMLPILVGRGDPPIKREEVFALLPEPLHELLPLETADALAASTRLLERLFVEPSLSEDLRREIAERVLANARALKTEGGR